MTPSNMTEILSFAKDAAVRAAELIKPYCGRVRSSHKADQSIVTEADFTSERFINSLIQERYPKHSILGEEGTAAVGSLDGPLWIIDPLDGTSSFARGIPMWGVSIGYFEDAKPVVGVFYLPELNQCFWATSDGDSFLNGERIGIAGPEEIDSESVIAVSADFHRVVESRYPGKVRCYGSLAANLCYVAGGFLTGSVSTKTHVWDIAAGALILDRAGGVIRYLDGRPVDWEGFLRLRGTKEFQISGHPEVVPEIARYIKPLAP